MKRVHNKSLNLKKGILPTGIVVGMFITSLFALAFSYRVIQVSTNTRLVAAVSPTSNPQPTTPKPSNPFVSRTPTSTPRPSSNPQPSNNPQPTAQPSTNPQPTSQPSNNPQPTNTPASNNPQPTSTPSIVVPPICP